MMMTINSFEKGRKKKISITYLNEKMINLTWHNDDKTKFIVEASAIISYYRFK